MKLILISQERGVGTAWCLLSSWLLTGEVNKWALVSINYNLPSLNRLKIPNVPCLFVLGSLLLAERTEQTSSLAIVEILPILTH